MTSDTLADRLAEIFNALPVNDDGAVPWSLMANAIDEARRLALESTPPKVGSEELDAARVRVAIEAMRADPFIDDFHLLGTRQQDMRMQHYAEVALAAPVDHPEVVGVKGWRCFHCDETFTDERCARDHFGCDETCEPACQIKMGAERSLLTALRRAEDNCNEMMQRLQAETTDSAKAYYAQTARHQEQLRIAEELGFERGTAALRPSDSPALEAGVAEALRVYQDLASSVMTALMGSGLRDGLLLADKVHRAHDKARIALAALSIPATEDGK